MLQRTHNCNGVNITNTSSICAFAIRPREQQHCRMCRRWSTKHRTEATASRKTDRQRDNKTNTHTEKDRQNNQEKRARENNETDTDKQQHSKRTRQDKRTTDC